MIALNLLSLFFISVIIPSLFSSKLIKLAMSIVFGIFICMEISAVFLGGSFIDYKYYYHFSIHDTLAVANGFIPEIIAFTSLIIMMPYIIFIISLNKEDKEKHFNFISPRTKPVLLKLKNNSLCQKMHAITRNIYGRFVVLTASLLIIVFSNNGIYSNFSELLSIVTSTEIDAENIESNIENLISNESEVKSGNENNESEKVSSELSSNSTKKTEGGYTKKRDLQARYGGKNIIIISLESFEKAFLNDVNKQLAPNLRALREKWAYYDMQPNNGSGWTAGSLYTVYTGFPCYFTGNGNSIFQNSKECKIVTLGDVFKKCGYTTFHLSNSADFAGTRDLLKIFKTDSIMDGTFHGKYQPANMPWKGASDRDIFQEAKGIIKQSKNTKPFVLFLSTLSTHHPNGFVDDKMLQYITAQKSTMETAALSTDWLVADLVAFLEKENELDNTVIYIFPDHLMHCNHEVISRTKENRGLWFMTNANKKDLTADTADFYQIDIAKNILSGAHITHNAKFLSDFINEDKADFMKKNLQKIATINTSSIIREKTVGESLCFELKNDNVICMVNKDTLVIKSKKSFENNTNLLLPMSKELRFSEIDMVTDLDLEKKCTAPYQLVVSLKNNNLNVAWVGDENLKVEKSNAKKVKFNSDEIQKIITTIPAKIKIPDVEKVVVNGSNANKETTLINYLNKVLVDDSKTVIMSAYDDASKQFESLTPILVKVGLTKSLKNKFRWSYLSVFSNSKVYYEELASSACYKKLTIDNSLMYLNSGGGDSKSPSHIIINNKEYSMCKRGLNVVIYNTVTKKVEDSFNVDTYADPQLTILRN